MFFSHKGAAFMRLGPQLMNMLSSILNVRANKQF